MTKNSSDSLANMKGRSDQRFEFSDAIRKLEMYGGAVRIPDKEKVVVDIARDSRWLVDNLWAQLRRQ